jgi:hypothetical protein
MLALVLARALNRALDLEAIESVEIISLCLLGLLRPESPSARAVHDIFLAAALALEQQPGTIPPPPIGIARVRTKAQTARPATAR